MICSIFTENIILYLDHELEKEQRAEFEVHLSKCKECESVFHQVKLSYTIIDSEKEFTISSNFMESIKQNLQPNKDQKIIRLFAEALKPLAIAASIALGIMIGNGEIALLNNDDVLGVEISDAFIPAAPTEYSIWATVNQDNGNQD